MLQLPIDPLLPEVVAHMRSETSLLLEAPPGAGKTTRVPPALLDIAEIGEIIVLEPRRLAARMAARRVAEEMGERPGETVGYQVRFDEVAGPRTRLRFVTEGILTRRLLSDPNLRSVGAVLLDEFHERHLQGDIALALLRRLQLTSRPDLRLIVMSATLEAAPVARFLDDCLTLRAEGRRFEVAIEHLQRPDDRPLEEQVATAVKRLVADGMDGDILVFLPGAAEIRRAREACSKIAAEADLLVLPLHGDLPPAEQDRAVRPGNKRKLILSTNVAESSVTIEGITTVIDSGLARKSSYSPWSGLPMLKVERISRASATQRAGRAGRTRPGRCLRLYTRQDYESRPEHETAEIHRADLAETVLELRAAGVSDPGSFEWFEAPPAAALEAAEALLVRLAALDQNGKITDLGRRMLRFPIHPRQARLIAEAEARGVAEEGCTLAALIGEREIRIAARGAGLTAGPEKRFDRGANSRSMMHASSDLLIQLDLFKEAEQSRFSAAAMRAIGLDPGATLAVDRVRRQLLDQLSRQKTGERGRRERAGDAEIDTALLISILAGYPDRVARCRPSAGGRMELLFAGGGSAQLAETSVVRSAEFLVAIDAEQRHGQAPGSQGAGRSAATIVRVASSVEPDWLLDLFIDSIGESCELLWNAQSGRVDVVRRLVYDQLVIDESRSPATGMAEAGEVLLKAALEAGPRTFARSDELDRFLARADFMAKTFPEEGFPSLGENEVIAALARLCAGRSSFAELREAANSGGLLGELQQSLTPEQLRLLHKMAPERVSISRRRNVPVNYEIGKQPWLQSRLQDFFGMATGPAIAGGRVPLVLHLLAPNQRPVQVTTDLAGFWSRTYQQVRKELSRRYPRHSWPDDPLKG
jgi:ATP-dependent helicase HrpB